jgi:hypothetical protein
MSPIIKAVADNKEAIIKIKHDNMRILIMRNDSRVKSANSRSAISRVLEMNKILRTITNY